MSMMIGVEKRIPKPKEMAIGIRKRACMDVSKIMGDSPKNVVSDVNMIGRKRRLAELMTASITVIPPASRFLLMVTTNF